MKMSDVSFWDELKMRMSNGTAPCAYCLFQLIQKFKYLFKNLARVALANDNIEESNYLYSLKKLDEQLTKNCFQEDEKEVELLLSQIEILRQLAEYLFSLKIFDNSVFVKKESAQLNFGLTSTQCSIRFEKLLEEFGMVAISNDNKTKDAYLTKLQKFETQTSLHEALLFQIHFLKILAFALIKFNTILGRTR